MSVLSNESNHICVFTSESQKIRTIVQIITPYIRNKIDLHLIVNQETEMQIRESISDLVENIFFYPSSESYGISNFFEYERSISSLTSLLSENGESIITILGEVDSLSNFIEEIETILKYEKQVNRLLENMSITAFCLYTLDKLSPEMTDQIMGNHPYVLSGGNLLKNLSYGQSCSELETICMYCMRLKRSEEVWERNKGSILPIFSENYSHGICPSCITNFSEYK